MKRFCIAVGMVLCATALMAAGLDQVVMKISSVSTSATPSTLTSEQITGWIERIDMTYANTTGTVYFTVKATNAFTKAFTTLLEPAAATATKTTYVPTVTLQTATGTALESNTVSRFALLNEQVTLSVTGAAYSGQSVQATIIYERP